MNTTLKVIIRDGVVDDVLQGDGIPAETEVEIVDIDKDYEDYEALDAYARQLHNIGNYKNADWCYADMKQENVEYLGSRGNIFFFYAPAGFGPNSDMKRVLPSNIVGTPKYIISAPTCYYSDEWLEEKKETVAFLKVGRDIPDNFVCLTRNTRIEMMQRAAGISARKFAVIYTADRDPAKTKASTFFTKGEAINAMIEDLKQVLISEGCEKYIASVDFEEENQMYCEFEYDRNYTKPYAWFNGEIQHNWSVVELF